jgi:hypothetical protein
MENQTAKNILATVAYYDELDYPLTPFEIWKYLVSFNIKNETCNNISLADILKELEEGKIRRFIQEKNGFYFLRGREILLQKRLRKNKISMAKIKNLKKIIQFLKFIPFVRMVAITGRLAMKNAERESDWDLLIVLKAGHIWIGRTFVTLFLHLIGKRRHGKKIRDRVCLNHFITDESLETKIQGLFASGEFSFMLPLFGGDVFEKFRKANEWIKKYHPNYATEEFGCHRLIRDTKISIQMRKVGEYVFGWNFLENFLRRIEKEKIEKNPLTQKEGGFILATDEALVFLPEPQGMDMLEKVYNKLQTLKM